MNDEQFVNMLFCRNVIYWSAWISFGFSGGQTLNAMGTAHPEHYEEFRQAFLSLMAESYQEISALPEE